MHINATGLTQPDGSLIGGNIDGNITAISDIPGSSPAYAIDTIRAGNRIRGTISTAAAMGQSKGINTVIVGPYVNAEGISGDIRSGGDIGRIFSTGTIGPLTSTANRPQITAQGSITQIRTIVEGGIGTLALRDVNADIKAGLRYNDPAAFDQLSTTESGNLTLLQVGGSLIGSVDVVNLGGINSTARTNEGYSGIVCRGPITAPIHVALNVSNGVIIGSSVNVPITIGWLLNGSIVAYDRSSTSAAPAGALGPINIGYAANVPMSWQVLFPGAGFTAPSQGMPVNLDPRFLRYDGMPDRTSEEIWFTGSASANENDGTIYGKVCPSIQVRAMFSGVAKDLKPRIEVGQIDKLDIGTMSAGVVWSGNLQYAGPDSDRRVANDRTDDYASIHQLSVECLSPTSDLYFQDCSLADIGMIQGVDFTDDLGEIHIPRLNIGETIKVRTRMSRFVQSSPQPLPKFSCPQQGVNTVFAFTIMNEPSPRARDVRPGYGSTALSGCDENALPLNNYADKCDREPGAALRSSIRIAEPAGLHGQIIVCGNAFLPSVVDGFLITNDFLGDVRLDAHRNEFEHLIYDADVNTVAKFRLPKYENTKNALGGGAIGLYPFAHKQQDSYPLAVTTGNLESRRYVSVSTFNSGSTPVRMSFYGPLTNASTASVLLQRKDASDWTTVSGYNVQLDLSEMNRDILVRGSLQGNSPVVRGGDYRLLVNGPDAPSVLCRLDVPGQNNPPAAPSEFYFTLSEHCLLNSSPHPCDIADGAGEPLPPFGVGEFNPGVDGGDFDCFFNYYFAAAPVNAVCDIADGLGDPLPSSGFNPGVDGGDFDCFFNYYFLPCQ